MSDIDGQDLDDEIASDIVEYEHRIAFRWPTPHRWADEAISGIVGQKIMIGFAGFNFEGRVISAEREAEATVPACPFPTAGMSLDALWLVVDVV